jgi:hypothetical protein
MTYPIAEAYIRPSHDSRRAFYRQLQIVERLDSPFNFRWKNNTKRIRLAKEAAYERFRDWQNGFLDLYKQANSEYDKLKHEKPIGPYRKDALYHNINPIFHNIAAYNVKGNGFYYGQMKRNLEAVLQRLEERDFFALRDYVLFLIVNTDKESKNA